jgi:hypothetical protein
LRNLAVEPVSDFLHCGHLAIEGGSNVLARNRLKLRAWLFWIWIGLKFGEDFSQGIAVRPFLPAATRIARLAGLECHFSSAGKTLRALTFPLPHFPGAVICFARNNFRTAPEPRLFALALA